MLDPLDRLQPQEEKRRYQLHRNDLQDTGYMNFLSPLIESVVQHFNVEHKGLDYGSGPEPVLTELLRERGFLVTPFDPFFCNNVNALLAQYDFIVCSETSEHFFDPLHEFQRLHALLKPGGKLFLLTALYDDGIDFENWHYKNDPTHVFFYTTKAFEFIRERFQFSALRIDKRLIELSL